MVAGNKWTWNFGSRHDGDQNVRISSAKIYECCKNVRRKRRN
jgi:hypothetical protein